MWRRLLLSLLAAGGSGCAAFSCYREPPPTVVDKVDLQRYAGTWYEIARFPNRFQKDCVASTATYTIRPDGGIDIVNRCRKGSGDGESRQARGRAWVADPQTNARLKVSFFWPFKGDYWIIDLDSAYTCAAVGHPRRKYLWVLGRTPAMQDEVYAGILQRLERNGYDTARLIKAGGRE